MFLQHIPYKGSWQALTDVIGSQVLMFINNPLTLIPHIKIGATYCLSGPPLRGFSPDEHARPGHANSVPTMTGMHHLSSPDPLAMCWIAQSRLTQINS